MIHQIIIVILLTLSHSYMMNKQYINSIEAGVATLDKKTFNSSGYDRQQFIIQFSFIFDNIPKMFFCSYSLQNCASSTWFFYIPYYYPSFVLSTTNCTLMSMYYLLYNNDVNHNVKISYLALDNIKITNILYYSNSGYQLPGDGVNVTFSKGGLTLSSTIMRCSVIGTWVINIVSNPFSQSCKITVINNTDFKVQMITSAETYYKTTTGVYYSYLQVIAILQDPHFSVNQGYLQQTKTSKPWGTVSLDLTQRYSQYFIGFNSFSTYNQCVSIGLDSTRQAIDQTSNLLSVTYFYLQIIVPQITFKTNVFPFSNNLSVHFAGLDYYSIKAGTTPFYSSTFSVINSFSSDTIFVNLSGPITYLYVDMSLYITKSSYSYMMQSHVNIVAVASMSIFVIKNKVEVQFVNIRETVDFNNFECSDTRLSENFVDNSGNERYLTLDYQKSIIGTPFTVTYTSTNGDNVSSIQLIISQISKIQTSAISTSSFLLISNIPYLDSSSLGRINWTSTHVENTSLTLVQSSTIVQANFNYKISAESTDLILTFCPYASTLSAFSISFSLRFITVKSVEYIVGSTTANIIFTNVYNPSLAILSQFSTSTSQLKVTSLSVIDTSNISLAVEYSSDLNESFSATYESTTFPYTVTTTDLNIAQRYVKFQYNIFTHWINFTFKNIQEISILPTVFTTSSLVLFNTTLSNNNQFIICTQFNADVDGSWLSLHYDIDPTTIYEDIVTVQLVSTSPIVFCVDEFSFKSEVYEVLCYIILALYLAIFIISMFFCQKIYGVEMMFALQFAFMTLIPIGVSCPPFNTLSLLRYSFGWNGIPFPVSETHIYSSYASLGFQSNVLSNINFMILPMLLCPIVYAIMTALGNKSTHFTTKPRLLVYGKAFIFDVLFTILLLNIPNICVSFMISLQAFGTSNIGSFISSLFLALLVVVGGILFIVYRNEFREFKSEFNTKEGIWKISPKTSAQLRIFYPLIMYFEIMGCSILLSIKTLFGISLYICLGVLCFTTLLTMFLTPYKNNLGNIRLFIYRLFMISICCVQIGFKTLDTKTTNMSSLVYDYPLILLCLVGFLPLTLFGPYVIFRAVLWVNSTGLKDNELDKNNKTKSSIISYPNNPPKKGSFYPASQFPRNLSQMKQHETDSKLSLTKKIVNIPLIEKINKHSNEYKEEVNPYFDD